MMYPDQLIRIQIAMLRAYCDAWEQVLRPRVVWKGNVAYPLRWRVR